MYIVNKTIPQTISSLKSLKVIDLSICYLRLLILEIQFSTEAQAHSILLTENPRNFRNLYFIIALSVSNHQKLFGVSFTEFTN